MGLNKILLNLSTNHLQSVTVVQLRQLLGSNSRKLGEELKVQT